MIIELNKDFLKEYKDDAWKGFSAKEIGCIVCAAVVAIVIDAVLYTFAHLSVATGIYIAVPAAFPIIMWGFFKYQGFLSVYVLIKEYLYHMKTAQLLYDSCENVPQRRVFTMKRDLKKPGKKGFFALIRKRGRKDVSYKGILYMDKKVYKERIIEAEPCGRAVCVPFADEKSSVTKNVSRQSEQAEKGLKIKKPIAANILNRKNRKKDDMKKEAVSK